MCLVHLLLNGSGKQSPSLVTTNAYANIGTQTPPPIPPPIPTPVWYSYPSIGCNTSNEDNADEIEVPEEESQYITNQEVEFSCSRAGDLDKKMQNGQIIGYFPDSMASADSHPRWDCSEGSWKDDDNIGTVVTWIAPGSPGEVTIDLYEEDLPSSIPPGEGGSRNDSERKVDSRTVIVKEIREYAISGHGAGHESTFDDRADHWTYWFSSSTGDEVISDLEGVCSSGYIVISGLAIFSHGYSLGIILECDKGLYYDKTGMEPEAADLDDMASEISSGDIDFTSSPVIKLQGCNLGTGNFAKKFSEITGGTAYGASGACSAEEDGQGKETGWFYSSESPWRKWVDGTEIQNPHLTDDDLTTPNQYGTNKLRFW